jgi:excinuclease ABC subunit A
VESASIHGWETLKKVVPVDQSALGKTPRSNAAVYVGAFDHIRELFAQSELARQRGLNASAFSFNSGQGQCEFCRGAGFEKIEMQFLSDVFIRCTHCNGKRYRPHILAIKISPESQQQKPGRKNRRLGRNTKFRKRTLCGLSIAELLDSTVDEAVAFLLTFEDSSHAASAAESLQLLVESGLGYLKLGQPLNTLSGGESQRLKLVRHLADARMSELARGSGTAEAALFLFDEPTTGLHFDDVRILLKLFQRLVDAGHSVLVVEHNLDVIKSSDWVIDLGPEGGDQGGQIVAEGTPEQIAVCDASHTGQALKSVITGANSRASSLCAA